MKTDNEPRTDRIIDELRRKETALQRRYDEISKELRAVSKALSALSKGNRRMVSNLQGAVRQAVSRMPKQFTSDDVRQWLLGNSAHDPSSAQLAVAIGHMKRQKEIRTTKEKRGRIGAIYERMK